ncbi:MAG: type II toxin-antitoxin system VapC family toxin [Candidatus Contendobacter sp.]|nr:type II toxin-antitoxin system VapC family toxin [Candidatus Contendobacter sp.]MDG4557938.1 type II toxin-antitoxin system VapC family toxin [Candidatus Contendobacter sp.]
MMALDASALLAFLFREPGHEQVGAMLDTACLSTVNLAEVIGRFVRDGHDAHQVLKKLTSTMIEIVPFTAVDAALAASLVPATQSLGLSLGDRACLALALSRNIPAITADRIWAQLRVGVTIQFIR